MSVRSQIYIACDSLISLLEPSNLSIQFPFQVTHESIFTFEHNGRSQSDLHYQDKYLHAY